MLQAEQTKNTKPETETWLRTLRRPERQSGCISQERRIADEVRLVTGTDHIGPHTRSQIFGL